VRAAWNSASVCATHPSFGQHLAFAVTVLPVDLLRLGTLYLRMLLDELGGSWEETLAAYNAGKSHATDWRTWGEWREPAEFVESIPFTETHDYVQAVLRNADMYRRIYAQ